MDIVAKVSETALNTLPVDKYISVVGDNIGNLHLRKCLKFAKLNFIRKSV